MNKPNLILPAVALLAATSFSAQAEIVQVNFTGTLTDVGSLFGAAASVGDAMTGSFEYDTTMAGAVTSFTVSFGAFSTTANTASLSVQNDQQNGSATNPADGMIISSSGSTSNLLNGLDNPYMQFGLRKENLLGQLWDDILPPDNADWALITLADINAPDWRILDFGQVTTNFWDDQIRWSVDAFSVTTAPSVPVPAAAWLFGSGLIGLIGMARRKVA